MVTVTDAGTFAHALSDVNMMVALLAPSGDLNVTVPTDVVPPGRLAGANVTAVSCGKLRTRATNPEKIIAPHPEAVSQPVVAFEAEPSGNVPVVPEVMS